jgi:hypothetical protein
MGRTPRHTAATRPAHRWKTPSRRLRVLVALSASFVSVSSVFFSSANVASSSFTTWFIPSSATQVFSVQQRDLVMLDRLRRRQKAGIEGGVLHDLLPLLDNARKPGYVLFGLGPTASARRF